MQPKNLESNAAAVPVAPTTPEFVNIEEAAQFLATSVWAMRELVWARKIPTIKIGRRYQFDVADLRAYALSIKRPALTN